MKSNEQAKRYDMNLVDLINICKSLATLWNRFLQQVRKMTGECSILSDKTPGTLDSVNEQGIKWDYQIENNSRRKVNSQNALSSKIKAQI